MSNKSTGTRFEKEFAGLLADQGFWVHLFQDNRNGQPCDVIAARNGHAYLFDCKDCQRDFFLLRRMEENQYNAMQLFEMAGNSRGKFAVRFPEGRVYLLDYWQVALLRDKGIRKINQADIRLYGVDFRTWLDTKNKIDGWGGGNEDYSWK